MFSLKIFLKDDWLTKPKMLAIYYRVYNICRNKTEKCQKDLGEVRVYNCEAFTLFVK